MLHWSLKLLASSWLRLGHADGLPLIYRMGGKFRGWKISCNSRFCLKISRVLIPPSTCIIFVSSATHEKREIKNPSKFSTRTIYQYCYSSPGSKVAQTERRWGSCCWGRGALPLKALPLPTPLMTIQPEGLLQYKSHLQRFWAATRTLVRSAYSTAVSSSNCFPTHPHTTLVILHRSFC